MSNVRCSHLLIFGLVCCLTPLVEAQVRPAGFYLQPGGGFTSFTDSEDAFPLDNSFQYWEEKSGFGSLEVGIHKTPGFGVGLAFRMGSFSALDDPSNVFATDKRATSSRLSTDLVFRVLPFAGSRISPFIQAGIHTHWLTGSEPDSFLDRLAGYGPTFGFGIYGFVSSKTALFIESVHHLTVPFVEGLPLFPDPFTYDYPGFIGAGFRFQFSESKTSNRPVVFQEPTPLIPDYLSREVWEIQGVSRGFVNDSLQFEAIFPPGLRADSLNITWTFGDGSTGTGKAVSHRYTKPGAYRVAAFDARNPVAPVGSKTVQVFELTCIPPVVASLAAPDSTTAGTPVRMSANLGGAPPDLFLWNFGDGSVSTEREPVKSFQPGSWSVALAVRNECGVDAASKRIFVDQVAECKLLDRLEPMYFNLEAMEMDVSDQLYLDSIIEMLDGCSQSCLMISGSGSADEDFSTRSRQRADNVARYFEVRGLELSRILSVEGMPEGSTCEGPGNSCRYVRMTSAACR